MNIVPDSRARQPARAAWSLEQLRHWRAVALGLSISTSTSLAYTSALQSWIEFCRLHNFATEPTVESISFYIVFMSFHIKPQSVASYLSGICNQLEAYFPDVRASVSHPVVRKTLAGMRRLRGTEQRRVDAISIDQVRDAVGSLGESTHHDDRLFLAIFLTAFFGLMRIGELCWPDRTELQDPRRLTWRHTAQLTDNSYNFVLPASKTDRYYEGARIVIQRLDGVENPVTPFARYVDARDTAFPYHPELWLRLDGTVPKYSWFSSRLASLFPDAPNVGTHSLRAGGATRMAELGASSDLIQAAGRWSSETFKIYIRKNPVILQSMLFGRPAFQDLQTHTR